MTDRKNALDTRPIQPRLPRCEGSRFSWGRVVFGAKNLARTRGNGKGKEGQDNPLIEVIARHLRTPYKCGLQG